MFRRLIISAIFIFTLTESVFATHIVGGELTYRCLGNDQYEIRLNVYRDCYNGVPPFDDPASVGIFDADFNLLQNLSLPFSQMDDTLTLYLNNPCLTAPPDVCVHRTTYMDTISLPFNPGGYSVVYQRCCRNKLIQNIPLPEDVGITIIAEISEKALLECNNGAVYRNWPPLAICVNEPIDFDHGATDTDGDSLVYRLCTPLSGADKVDPQPDPPNPGPYTEITWNDPPYNLMNLLGGIPLTIDPATGFITGVPNTIGNFVVGVCVDEYRDDVVISTLRRDFQYNVADCGVPVASFFSPERLCDQLTVQFNNQSITNPNASNTITQWYFDWLGNRDLKSTDFSPTFTFPDTGYYTVALVINPGFTCCDTFLKTIYLTRTTATANAQINFGLCDDTGVEVHLFDQSTDTQHDIIMRNWNVYNPSGALIVNTPETNPTFFATAPGNYIAYLVVTAENGCTAETSVTFSVPIPPLITLATKLVICPGDSVELFPGANPAFTYNWSPGTGLSSVTAPNPIAHPEVSTLYTLTITDATSLCTRIRTVDVQVLSPGILTAIADPTTILQGQSSQLTAYFPNALGYQWTPPGSLSDASIANPIASPTDSTTYTVVITTSTGCSPTATVRVLVVLPQCDMPYVFFPTAFSPNGDSENDVLKLESRTTTEVYWTIFSRWGEQLFEATDINQSWDGTFKGKPMPAETYGYYLRVRCLNNEILERKGNITLLR